MGCPQWKALPRKAVGYVGLRGLEESLHSTHGNILWGLHSCDEGEGSEAPREQILRRQ